MSNEFIWVEKYRPTSVKDIILPNRLKSELVEVINKGEIQNMMFFGTAGLGKTTSAKAICNDLDCNWLLINGSKERNIDTLRDKITNFAMSKSINGKSKVVIIDEADNLNANSFQQAFRASIEQFSSNCRFILTLNYKDKLIEPLHSRFAMFDFNVDKKETLELSGLFMKRLMVILNKEGIEYDNEDLAKLIFKFAPDWRRVLNECQRFTSSGVLSFSGNSFFDNSFLSEIMGLLKEKNFKQMRSWVSSHSEIDIVRFIDELYLNINEYIEPKTIPQAVLILNEYQYKNAFVVNKQLNMISCLTELMSEVSFK